MMPSETQTILIIEDDPMVLSATASLVRAWGYDVLMAGSADEAIKKATALGQAPDLIIIDYGLSGEQTGLDAYNAITQLYSAFVPGIVITGETTPELLDKLDKIGLPHLMKPINPEALEQSLPILLT
ncbi:response regulator [Magnetovibrio sp. PR-2]|uniref:response regulator n=1 Tax=Magnetovibrio sp. PR-2 TaxID=3120356 RepID=UPI002FCE6059